MDLKKNKKLKKKFNGFRIMVKKFVGLHLYRSTDKYAPFSKWQRLTGTPQKELRFTDSSEEDGEMRYYYKYTEVDIYGNESEPREPKKRVWTQKDAEEAARNPLNKHVGYNIYRSTDRDLPLDQWQRLNEETLPTTGYEDKGLISGVTYYYYVTSVSAAGLESLPSDIVEQTAL